MSEKLKEVTNFIKQNKETIALLVSIIVVLILIILVGLSIANKVDERIVVNEETLDREEEDEANKGQENPDIANNTDNEPSETNASTEYNDSSNDQTIKVEKAPVNDEGDPQSNNTSGLTMDIGSYTDGEGESKQKIYGIDVAKWQGVIDWAKVKESGVGFVMIRVGYRTLDKGIIQEDPYAEYNLQQATKHGIKIGAYFFSTAINEIEAIEEAKWVTDFISPYPITYPVAYNCEDFNNPNNRQYNLSQDERSSLAITFLDYVEDKGYTPMFYAAKNELEGDSQWNTTTLANKYKIWVAQYPATFTTSSKSSYSDTHHMWQYTSNGQIAGIDKPVDLNIAYFGYETVVKPQDNTPQETVEADPTALINFEEVNEKITAKDVTNLRDLPSTSGSEVVGLLNNGETINRIGIGDNGWSKLIYNGSTVYARTSLLTTDLETSSPQGNPNLIKGQLFKPVNEQVTAKDLVNLRSDPSQANNDNVKVQLKNGQVATRTGIGDKGWSRIELDGQVYYVVSSYITKDLDYKKTTPAEKPPEPQQEVKPSLNNPEAGMNFIETNDKVTAKIETNLRNLPSTDNGDLVKVLVNGEIAIRTGKDVDSEGNGWARLEYNGQVLYAVNRLLDEVE